MITTTHQTLLSIHNNTTILIIINLNNKGQIKIKIKTKNKTYPNCYKFDQKTTTQQETQSKKNVKKKQNYDRKYSNKKKKKNKIKQNKEPIFLPANKQTKLKKSTKNQTKYPVTLMSVFCFSISIFVLSINTNNINQSVNYVN